MVENLRIGGPTLKFRCLNGWLMAVHMKWSRKIPYVHTSESLAAERNEGDDKSLIGR